MRIGYRQRRTAEEDTMQGLAGKRVVVTGGTSGIGAATAQRFRDEGCEVVVLARTPGPDVIQCDVGDREQVERAFAQIGSLDVLDRQRRRERQEPGAGHRRRPVGPGRRHQPRGAFWVAQAAARRMLAGGRRRHPLHGLDQRPGRLPLLRRLQRDQGRPGGAGQVAGARVGAARSASTPCAPATCSRRCRRPSTRRRCWQQVNRRIPLGRHATPEELAGLFAYLASDEAAYFTGSVIVMDGGETAGSVVSGPGGPGA